MSVYNGNLDKPAGRTSSQRSINDYPEHLNPFYEDENHKRLRFWKIGSSDKKVGRSNSFSIDSFKDFWSLKTFRLKKKSSTLGINRTSESPPTLRHVDESYGSRTTINGQARHTVDVGLASNFQRGVAYRSSLQELNSNNQIDNYFLRNNRYRSTMQASNQAIMSSPNRNAPVTPVFRSRYSSQTSVNSTNPFDDDYLDTMSTIESPIRRSARKKRRAPQPPQSLSTTSQSPTKSITTVGEETNAETENENITNLTAQIESFVRTADTDKETIATNTELRISENGDSIQKSEEVPTEHTTNSERKESRESPESNDFYPQDEHAEPITLEKIQNLGASDLDVTNNNSERCKSSPVKIFVRAPSDEDAAKTGTTVVEIECDYETTNAVQETDKAECESNEKPVDEEVVKSHVISEESNEEEKNQDESEKIFQKTGLNGTENGSAELRITESSEDLRHGHQANGETKTVSEASSTEEAKISTVNGVEKPLRLFEVRTVPLKTDSPVALRRRTIESDGSLIGPQKPSRRRSVKEIIESINKCQGLLKLNQEQRTRKIDKERSNSFTASTSSPIIDKNHFVDRNMNDLAGKRYNDKKMFTTTNEINNNRGNDDDSYNIPLVVQELNEATQRERNPQIFEKCLARNSSNKTSTVIDDKLSNIDWNPVPKPRRHRHTKETAIN